MPFSATLKIPQTKPSNGMLEELGDEILIKTGIEYDKLNNFKLLEQFTDV